MPIYEYRCDQGHTFEVMQRMSDEQVIACQTCDAPVQRVFHPIAVHFKGSGFYNTDYGTRNRSREKAETGDGAAKNGDSSKSNSDSKSETKTAKSPAPSASSSSASD
jgi:putative FmdB family regulatory protein